MKFFKILICAMLVLFSINLTIIPGQAETKEIPKNVTVIKDISDFYKDFDLDEVEDNLGTDTYGKYFLVDLPSTGYFHVYSSGQQMVIYDEEMELVGEAEHNDYGEVEYNKLLKKGNYYVQVTADYPYSNLEISGSFTTIFEEQESNDEQTNANDITLFLQEKDRGTITGSFQSDADVDMYSFTTTNKLTSVYIDFQNIISSDQISLSKPNGESVGYNVFQMCSEYDENDECIKYGDNRLYAELPAGVYILTVTGTTETKGKNYTLDIEMYKTTASFKETEPNDEITSANDITEYLAQNDNSGYLNGEISSVDKDTYRFTLEEWTKVSFYTGYYDAEDYSISLVREDETKVDYEYDELIAELPKGTYYLKVSGTQGDKSYCEYDESNIEDESNSEEEIKPEDESNSEEEIKLEDESNSEEEIKPEDESNSEDESNRNEESNDIDESNNNEDESYNNDEENCYNYHDGFYQIHVNFIKLSTYVEKGSNENYDTTEDDITDIINSTIEINNSDDDYYEYNPNLRGAFEKEQDVDYYKFTLDKKLTKLSFYFNNTDIQAKSINLYDENHQKVKFKLTKYKNLYVELPAGTYYLKLDGPSNKSDEQYVVDFNAYEITPPVNVNDVTVQNNIGDNDIVTINNLTVGRNYYIGWGENDYRVFKATNTKQTIVIGPLEKTGGSIIIESYDFKTGYSSDTVVNYSAEPEGVTEKVNLADVAVENNYNKDDEISLNNLEKGTRYTIYTDESLTNEIANFTASSTKVTINVDNLNPMGGSIYITAQKIGYKESAATEVKYDQQPFGKTQSINANGDVVVDNKVNEKDVITFKNPNKDTTYIVYNDKTKSKVLGTLEYNGSKNTILIDQLGKEAGSIYITATQLNYIESDLVEIKYAKESLGKTPQLSASNVTVKNNYKKDDTISFKNLTKGVTYYIYRNSNLSRQSNITGFVASSTTATINVDQLSAGKGVIYIVAKENNKEESKTTIVTYSAEQLPAIAAKNVVVANNIGNDKITLNGLTKGFTYSIYSDAKLTKRVAYVTATKATHALAVKQVGAKAGSLYVVVSKSGYTNSVATKVNFKAQPTVALAAKNVKVTNAKKQDTIKFSGLKKGTTYVIYKDVKKKKKLTSFKATGKTKTVTVKQLGKSAGKIYITAQDSGYEVSNLTAVSYSKEK